VPFRPGAGQGLIATTPRARLSCRFKQSIRRRTEENCNPLAIGSVSILGPGSDHHVLSGRRDCTRSPLAKRSFLFPLPGPAAACVSRQQLGEEMAEAGSDSICLNNRDGGSGGNPRGNLPSTAAERCQTPPAERSHHDYRSNPGGAASGNLTRVLATRFLRGYRINIRSALAPGRQRPAWKTLQKGLPLARSRTVVVIGALAGGVGVEAAHEARCSAGRATFAPPILSSSFTSIQDSPSFLPAILKSSRTIAPWHTACRRRADPAGGRVYVAAHLDNKCT